MKAILIILFYVNTCFIMANDNVFFKKAKSEGVKVCVPETMMLYSQEEVFYPCITTPEDNPVPNYSTILAQCVPEAGNKGINAILGMVTAVLTDKEGRYVILVNFRGGGEKYEGTNTQVKYLNDHLAYSAIRADLRYGRYSNPSDSDMDEITEMMTVYPIEQANKFFNAKAMVSYPISLYDNAYLSKYTRCKALVVGRKSLVGYVQTIHFYVLMTDESSKNFDSYIADLSRCFSFE